MATGATSDLFQQGSLGLVTLDDTCNFRLRLPGATQLTTLAGPGIAPAVPGAYKCGGALTLDGTTLSLFLTTLTILVQYLYNAPSTTVRQRTTPLPNQHSQPNSIAYLADGTTLVASPDGTVTRYTPSGTGFLPQPLGYDLNTGVASSDLSTEGASGFIDVTRDGRNIFYTSALGDKASALPSERCDGTKVYSFDTQSPTARSGVAFDFGDGASRSTQLSNGYVYDGGYALRILPTPLTLTDGAIGKVLVVHYTNIALKGTLPDRSTTGVIQTYDTDPGQAAVNEDFWAGLALDPDGTTFWSVGRQTDTLYQFDVATPTMKLALALNSTRTSAFSGGAASTGYLPGYGSIGPWVVGEVTAALSAGCEVPCCSACATPTTCTAYDAGCIDKQCKGCPHQALLIPTGQRCGGSDNGCCQAYHNHEVVVAPPPPPPLSQTKAPSPARRRMQGKVQVPMAYPNCGNPFPSEEPAYCKSAAWVPWDCPTLQCEGTDSCVCNQGDCTCQTAANTANLVGNSNQNVQIAPATGSFDPSRTVRSVYIAIFCSVLGICSV